MKLEGYIYEYCNKMGITCITDVLFKGNLFNVNVLFMNQVSNLYENNKIYFMFIDKRKSRKRQYSDYIRLLTQYFICLNHNNRHIAKKVMVRELLYGGQYGIYKREEWYKREIISS